MSELTLDDQHVYRLDGQIIPGCTEVIRAAGLMDYDGVPSDVLEAAQWRGTAVHRACWYDDEGDLDEANLADEVRPYLDAWRQAKRALGVQRFAMIEKPLFHFSLRYGVTPDRVMSDTVIDLKTGGIQPWMAVQLAAQLEAVNLSAGAVRVYRRIACRLVPGRLPPFVIQSYPLKDLPADFEIFRSALNLCNWKARHNS